jgi:acyl-coenzyme A thioesterase PaaI-like protein
MPEQDARKSQPRAEVVGEGEWAGWYRRDRGDSFEGMTGPFYWRKQPDGSLCAALRAEQKHMNGGGFMHGGCLLTFADFVLFMLARKDLGPHFGVTATLNGEFIGSVYVGDLLEGTGEVVKAGGSLIFLRGMLRVAERPVLAFSGVVKRLQPRAK